MSVLSIVKDVIEQFLDQPSDWSIVGSSGGSASLGVGGIAADRLLLGRSVAGRTCRCTCTINSISAGISSSPGSISGSATVFPSGWLNRIYIGKMRNYDLEPNDFGGAVRTININWGMIGGVDFNMYVFGTAATAVSLATSFSPPLAIASLLLVADAIAFYSSTCATTPNAGISTSIGYSVISDVVYK